MTYIKATLALLVGLVVFGITSHDAHASVDIFTANDDVEYTSVIEGDRVTLEWYIQNEAGPCTISDTSGVIHTIGNNTTYDVYPSGDGYSVLYTLACAGGDDKEVSVYFIPEVTVTPAATTLVRDAAGAVRTTYTVTGENANNCGPFMMQWPDNSVHSLRSYDYYAADGSVEFKLETENFPVNGVYRVLATCSNFTAPSAVQGVGQSAGISVSGTIVDYSIPTCPLDTTGKTLVTFPDRLRQDVPPRRVSDSNESVTLGAGVYRIETYSWDGYPDRELTTDQKEEQWHVQLLNAGSQVTVTANTDDLPEGTIGVTSNVFQVTVPSGQTVDQVIARHKNWATGGGPANSVQPVCITIEDVTAAPPSVPSCPFTPSADQAVVYFDQYITTPAHVALDASQIDTTDAESFANGATLPDGATYPVVIASWDGGVDRAIDTQPQTFEQFRLEFLSSSGGVVGSTGLTDDVPDDKDNPALVETNVTTNSLSGVATRVRAVHGTEYNTTVNSAYTEEAQTVRPICAAVDISGVTVDNPVSVSLTSDTLTLDYPGQSINLEWDSENAASCSLTSSPNVINRATMTGSESVTLNQANTTYSFTYTCEGVNGDSDTAGPLFVTVGSTVSDSILPNLVIVNYAELGKTLVDNIRGLFDVDLRTRVRNVGVADTGTGFNNTYEIDIDDGWGAFFPDSLQQDESSSSLAPGTRTNVNTTLDNIPFGRHRVLFETDSNYNVTESNEDDNELTGAYYINIDPPRPPMQLFPDRNLVRAGDTVEVTYRVQAGFPVTCTVYGPFDPTSITGVGGVSGDTIEFSTNHVPIGTPVGWTEGTVTSRELNNSTNFEMRCIENTISSPAFSFEPERASVEVIPEYQE